MRHGTRWWGWLAVVSIFALLFGFDRVVHQIVDRGDQRRAAERERYSATWRCQLLATRRDQADCRLALR